MNHRGHHPNPSSPKMRGWSPFTYRGGSLHPRGKGRESLAAEVSADLPGVALATTQVGDRVRIIALNGGESNPYLIGMGLVPGVHLVVMSCTGSGSVVVALQDQRLGLGADMAQRIQVDVIDALEVELGAGVTPTISSPLDPPPVRLQHAAIGSQLRVVGYEPMARDYKRKLLAMGLTPGTELRVTRHAPLGDPTEIEVRNFRLSLRKHEADALITIPVIGA